MTFLWLLFSSLIWIWSNCKEKHLVSLFFSPPLFPSDKTLKTCQCSSKLCVPAACKEPKIFWCHHKREYTGLEVLAPSLLEGKTTQILSHWQMHWQPSSFARAGWRVAKRLSLHLDLITSSISRGKRGPLWRTLWEAPTPAKDREKEMQGEVLPHLRFFRGILLE